MRFLFVRLMNFWEFHPLTDAESFLLGTIKTCGCQDFVLTLQYYG